jgi:hypothetical protein
MAFSDLTPLLVVIKNNVVKSAVLYKSAEQLEKAFTEECFSYGVEPTDANFDNGYMELEDGTSINMTWV